MEENTMPSTRLLTSWEKPSITPLDAAEPGRSGAVGIDDGHVVARFY
jgi:hypothetical protein